MQSRFVPWYFVLASSSLDLREEVYSSTANRHRQDFNSQDADYKVIISRLCFCTSPFRMCPIQNAYCIRHNVHMQWISASACSTQLLKKDEAKWNALDPVHRARLERRCFAEEDGTDEYAYGNPETLRIDCRKQSSAAQRACSDRRRPPSYERQAVRPYAAISAQPVAYSNPPVLTPSQHGYNRQFGLQNAHAGYGNQGNYGVQPVPYNSAMIASGTNITINASGAQVRMFSTPLPPRHYGQTRY